MSTAPDEAAPRFEAVLIAPGSAARESLALALAMRGYQVDARDPGVGLGATSTRDYQLAIVGPMSSANELHAVLRQLKALPWSANASVVACVPGDRPLEIIAALEAGATSYLSIPLDAAQLRARLDRAERRLTRSTTQDAEIAALRHGGERYRALVEHSLDLFMILGVDGTIQWVSESTMPLLGYVPAELSGTNAFRLFHPDDAGRVLASLSDALQQAEMTETIDARMLRSDDEWTHVEMRVRDLQEQPSIGGLLLVARDITERKQFEEQLERRALYDALTGLPNRVLFMDYLSHSLARAERRLESVVVMFLDLDNFKRVNDTWGHGAGDQLLAKVAERLRNALRAVDSAARLSGDEFTVLLEDVRTESDAATVAERVLRALGNPFELSGTIVPVTTSIGIAISRPGESSAGALLHEADIALYRAKAAGKARWVLYNQQQATDSASDAAEHTYPADVAVSAPPPTRPATTVAAPPATSDEALQTLLQRVIDLERQAGWLEAEVERERGRHQP